MSIASPPTAAPEPRVVIECGAPPTVLAPLPSPAQLPAVVVEPVGLTALRVQDRFSRLVETRGASPAPRSWWLRALNGSFSWGVVAAAPGLAACAAGVLVGMPELAVVGGMSSLVLGFFGAAAGQNSGPTPLALYGGHRKLTAKDLAFTQDPVFDSPVGGATLSLLAEDWLGRVDAGHVKGYEAQTHLEQLIKRGVGATPEASASAAAIMAVCKAVRDSDGHPLRSLAERHVTAITTALENLPPREREVICGELRARYFRGADPRVAFEDQASARSLYRTLRDGINATHRSNEALTTSAADSAGSSTGSDRRSSSG